MSATINLTNNEFYETIQFKKNNLQKALFLPNEANKVNLGSNLKKFDNVYVNKIPGHDGRITTGTWTPSFDWRDENKNPLPPSYRKPTPQIIEARYQKIGNQVFCFCVFSVTVYQDSSIRSVLSSLRGIPFRINQRGRALVEVSSNRNIPQSLSSNVFNYNFSEVSSYRGALYLDSNPSSPNYLTIVAGGYDFAFLFYTNRRDTKYFYLKFNYRSG